ncbi:MAG: glycosyltransferase family protein [DPANN group archaeon]|nr:glycosyltransferase family protein [DPANN group archaeon]
MEFLGKKVIICLAVRLHSKRLPKKALLEVAGQSMIEHEIDRLKTTLFPVVLCTSNLEDDKPLIEIAKKKNIKYVAGDPLDVLGRFIAAAEMEGADIVVRTTGDRPLISPEHVTKLVEHHIKEGAEYSHYTGSPLPAGLWCEVFTLAAMKKCHELAQNPNSTEYMTAHFRRPDVFKIATLDVGEWFKRNYRLCLDAPEDFELIKLIYETLYDGENIIPAKNVIKFLDENPVFAKINAHVTERDLKEIDKEMNLKLKTDT